jgi:hypothetical protein
VFVVSAEVIDGGQDLVGMAVEVVQVGQAVDVLEKLDLATVLSMLGYQKMKGRQQYDNNDKNKKGSKSTEVNNGENRTKVKRKVDKNKERNNSLTHIVSRAYGGHVGHDESDSCTRRISMRIRRLEL